MIASSRFAQALCRFARQAISGGVLRVDPFASPRASGRTRLTSETGSSLLELALLSPLFLLLLAGSVDLGQASLVAIEVSGAASAGAEYGIGNPTDASGIQRAAALSAGNLNGLTVTTNWGCECADGTAASAGCTQNPSCSTSRVKFVAVSTSLPYLQGYPFPG